MNSLWRFRYSLYEFWCGIHQTNKAIYNRISINWFRGEYEKISNFLYCLRSHPMRCRHSNECLIYNTPSSRRVPRCSRMCQYNLSSIFDLWHAYFYGGCISLQMICRLAFLLKKRSKKSHRPFWSMCWRRTSGEKLKINWRNLRNFSKTIWKKYHELNNKY